MKNSSKKKLYKHKYSGVTRRAMPMGPHHGSHFVSNVMKVTLQTGFSHTISKRVCIEHSVQGVLADHHVLWVIGVVRFPDDPTIPVVANLAKLEGYSIEEAILWCDTRGFKQCRKSTVIWLRWWILIKQGLKVDVAEAFKWLMSKDGTGRV